MAEKYNEAVAYVNAQTNDEFTDFVIRHLY